jgi:hypothetical protein
MRSAVLRARPVGGEQPRLDETGAVPQAKSRISTHPAGLTNRARQQAAKERERRNSAVASPKKSSREEDGHITDERFEAVRQILEKQSQRLAQLLLVRGLPRFTAPMRKRRYGRRYWR